MPSPSQPGTEPRPNESRARGRTYTEPGPNGIQSGQNEDRAHRGPRPPGSPESAGDDTTYRSLSDIANPFFIPQLVV